MQKLMGYITAGSISFTFSNLLYLLFSELSIFPPFSNQMAFNMLYITVAILILIYLTSLLPTEHSFTIYALELLSVIIVLISASFFFKFYPFQIQYLLPILFIGLMTYVIVFMISYINNRKSAERINSLIIKRNEGQTDG